MLQFVGFERKRVQIILYPHLTYISRVYSKLFQLDAFHLDRKVVTSTICHSVNPLWVSCELNVVNYDYNSI